LAVSLPALVLLVAVAVGAIATVRTQLECVDAAREAVRAAARGESGEAAGRRSAPDGASVTVVRDGDEVRATVRARVLPAGSVLPGLELTATAVAAVEPGVGS
jgi:hypothetical protein